MTRGDGPAGRDSPPLPAPSCRFPAVPVRPLHPVADALRLGSDSFALDRAALRTGQLDQPTAAAPADRGGGLFGIEDSFAKSSITVVDSCVVATVEHFRTHVLTHKPALLTILAHGDRLGGAIYFHSGASPSDAAPLDGAELANLLRRAGTRVALLWSCQAARPHQHGAVGRDVKPVKEFGLVLKWRGALVAAGFSDAADRVSVE